MKLWKRKSVVLFTVVTVLVSIALFSEKSRPKQAPELFPDSCTSIMVGRLASSDGSTITSHTCDGPYRNWVEIVPAKDYPDTAVTAIYKGSHWTESPSDSEGLHKTGEIPQATHTFAYFNTAYPAMNEHQLSMGETTIMAERKLKSDRGLFQVEELQRIALQRCRTAREAIRLMGELIKTYGYIDGAECLTIIDPREVWQFEVFGPGLGNMGGVWAAARIPDDHVGVSANYPRIGILDLKNPDFYMASENIYTTAKELNLWDGKEPFKVYKAYGSSRPETHERYLRYCRLREWWVLNSLAPSLKLDVNMEELPFSVKPDTKVSVRQVMVLMRSNYAGTEYDIIKNLGKKDEKTGEIKVSDAVHPWITGRTLSLFSDLNPDLITYRRMIAINFCSYSTVIQSRSWLPDAVGGITWFSFDNPAFSARIPIFAGTLKLLDQFAVSNQKRFRLDSAAWAYRRAVRLAQPQWFRNREIIERTIHEFEEKAFTELPDLEKRITALLTTDRDQALNVLTDYVNHFSRAIVSTYWELGDRFWPQYTSGF